MIDPMPKRSAVSEAAAAMARKRAASLTAEERQSIARHAGLQGGIARAEKMTKKQRRAVAKKGAAARWAGKGE